MDDPSQVSLLQLLQPPQLLQQLRPPPPLLLMPHFVVSKYGNFFNFIICRRSLACRLIKNDSLKFANRKFFFSLNLQFQLAFETFFSSRRLLISQFFSGCGLKNFQTRIVGGRPSKKNAWPWLAALLRPTNSGSGQYCGAALISPNHILTAAHCIDP